MNSIWTDLLHLHGHVTPKDLAWRPDAPAKRTRGKVIAKTERSLLARCAAVWPRLMGPR